MVYNMKVFDRQPLGYDPEKMPSGEAERLALETVKNALSQNPGVMRPDDAAAALERAAAEGYPHALYLCGWIYQYQPLIFLRTWYYGERGSGLLHYNKAEKYYLMAMRAGDEVARYALASLYLFGTRYGGGLLGKAPLRGLIHMVEAARAGVARAAEVLSLLFSGEIYRDGEELTAFLAGIEGNKYRDSSVLRYDAGGALVFDPNALGVLDPSSLRDEILAAYWRERVTDPWKEEPCDVSERLLDAMARFSAYEKEYLANLAPVFDGERQDLIALRREDAAFRRKERLREEMNGRVAALPHGFNAGEQYRIYDEYEEKEKKYRERKEAARMETAIGIGLTPAHEGYDQGESKFFGTPTLPAAWVDDFYDSEMFLCQIRLADIADLDVENRLPHTGYLYVFLDLDVYPYACRVRYYDGEPDTVIDNFNLSVEGAEHLTDAYLMRFSTVAADAEGIKLLGTPADWSYEEEPPRLLLQYDPLVEDLGFLTELDGFAYLAFADGSDNLDDVTYFEERG